MVHEIIHAQCPECSPDEAVPHKILKEKPGLLLKCTHCDAVHPHLAEKKKTTDIRVVVSTGETSTTRKLILDSDEDISIGDEFVVEDESTGEANFIVVTSIESNGKRIDRARADEIQTVWARSIDRVTAKVSITKGWQTESIDMEVPGDHQFTIGEIVTWGPDRFLIKKIKIREGGFIKKEGDTAAAKHIKRIYADSMERVEWLNRPEKTFKKGVHRPRSSRSLIKRRGSSTWTLKRKGGG